MKYFILLVELFLSVCFSSISLHCMEILALYFFLPHLLLREVK